MHADPSVPGGSGGPLKPQDDKALKVAALSQALNFFDKFRKNQESKEDKTVGPDAAEIEVLASNMQEASQGVSAPASKGFPFLNSIEGNDQHLSDIMNEEQLGAAGRAGEGFCAAVSLNDGEYSHQMKRQRIFYSLEYRC